MYHILLKQRVLVSILSRGNFANNLEQYLLKMIKFAMIKNTKVATIADKVKWLVTLIFISNILYIILYMPKLEKE